MADGTWPGDHLRDVADLLAGGDFVPTTDAPPMSECADWCCTSGCVGHPVAGATATGHADPVPGTDAVSVGYRLAPTLAYCERVCTCGARQTRRYVEAAAVLGAAATVAATAMRQMADSLAGLAATVATERTASTPTPTSTTPEEPK